MLVGSILCISLLVAQSLQVTSVFPPPNSNSASSNTQIQIDFNLPVDTVGLKQQLVVLGSMRALYDFDITIDADLQHLILHPAIPFLIGEIVQVTVRSTLFGSSGENFDGFNWNFRIQPTLSTSPNFSSPIIYSQFPSLNIIPADINDDGAIDLILSDPSITHILVNDGMGNFSLHQNLPGAFTNKIWMLDGDLDDKRDLVLVSDVYEQANDGFFYYDSTLQPVNSDMNNDGFPDLVFLNNIFSSDSLYYIGIRINDGTGGLSNQVDTIVVDSNIGDLTVGDFNNDGIADIAYYTSIFAIPGGVGGHNSLRVVYMASNGDTLYRNIYNEASFPSGDPGMGFRILSADFNNDGFADILLQTNFEDLVIFNDTHGGFLTMNPEYISSGDLYHWSTIGDITGDSWLDLVSNFDISIVEKSSTVYFKNEAGQFAAGVEIYQEDPGTVYTSVIADFNGDGAQDIATTWFNGLYIHFNRNVQGVDASPASVPRQFTLYQNFPNPFNGNTIIPFYLSTSGFVNSAIYDLNGREVVKFRRQWFPVGENQLRWDGTNQTGKEVSSGIYLWKFEFRGISKTIKIVLLR